MAIVTNDFVIANGEYSDPKIVSLRHQGGGNYYWRSKKQPEGTMTIYHTIPFSKTLP